MAGAAARLYVDIEANVAGAIAGMKATDAQLKKTAATAKATSATMKGASVGYTAIGTSAVGASKANESYGRSAKKAATANRDVAKTGQAARGSMQGFGAASTVAQGGAFALAYGLTKMVSTAANFDSAMRNVNSIAGLSEGKFQSLKESVNALAGQTAQAPQTLAEGMYQLVSSGFSAGESLKIIKSSAIAATAGLTDTATATTAVAGVLNAYHLNASKAQQVSDDLFQTVNLGVLSFEDLAQGIGPVLPFAERLGVNLKQVGAMTATLTKAGVPAAESFTYMKGAMAQLVKPTADLKREYKQLGVESGAELVRKTGSLQGALEALWQSSGRNDKKFAKLFPDIRGLSAAFTATGSGARGAAQDLRNFADTAGQTAKVFKEQAKGDAFGFKQLSADIKQLSVQVGGPLAQNLSKVTHAASGGAKSKVGKSAIRVLLSDITALPTDIVGRFEKLHRVVAGTGAKLSQVKGGYEIKVKGGGEAKKQITSVTLGLNRIPGITTARIKIISPDDVVATRTKTALTKLAKPITITTRYKRSGDADTVVKPKAVRITADNSDVKAKTEQAKGFVESVNGLKAKPKITARSNSAAVKQQTLQDLAAVDGKTAHATVIVNYRTSGKPKGLASGGRVGSSAPVEVNERGAESARFPGGTIAMLGDGRRQVMPLPVGTHVFTASQTKRMAIQHLAGGGKVKDRRDKRIQRGLDTIDYNAEIGKYSTAKQIKELEKLAKIKGRADMRRQVRLKLHDLKVSQKSAIRDLQDQAAAVGLDPVGAALIAQKTAGRHLAEARKTKNAEKIAQAQLEVAQANNDLLEAQKQAQEAAVDAIKANTDAMTELGKQISESNRIATTTHNVSNSQVTQAVLDIFNKGMGGKLAMSQRTLGPSAAY